MKSQDRSDNISSSSSKKLHRRDVLMRAASAAATSILPLPIARLAHAQVDPADVTYSLGAILASPSQMEAFPKAPELLGPAPSEIDHSRFFPPVGDQKDQGSCSAWAAGYALRSFYLARDERVDVSLPQNQPSPAYIYNHANWNTRDELCRDAGMFIYTALDILKGGVLSLADMPYDDNTCKPAPDARMQARATKFRILAWQFVYPKLIDQVKQQIAAGNPLVFGTRVCKSFMGHRGDGNYSRDPKEKPLKGGHAMVLIGYSDGRRALRVQNSWMTPPWGNNGRGWISYDTFLRDANDAYVIYPARP
jgi:C1A family cysteine protease